jgi:hypothetical protein
MAVVVVVQGQTNLLQIILHCVLAGPRLLTAGSSPINIAMIAITTRSSINVNARRTTLHSHGGTFV